MRKQTILASGILLAIAVAGCNPVGMEDTKIWVTGTIYVDSAFIQPAEGIGVITEGTQESYAVVTDASGEYVIEIQLYNETEEGGAAGGKSTNDSTPGSAVFTVTAINGGMIYEYGAGAEFTVFGGDTLSLYAIDLADFTQPDGS
ncbi:MAG: hypothetical protein K8R76_07780 [Candidatus Aegiribacteria sp.]|nr:hypothetical protein [Candidatus Aegiribacteria sp.]